MKSIAQIAMLFPLAAFAQDLQPVHAQLEKPTIRIGEHVVLRIHTDATGPEYVWPLFRDTLTAHIEIVKDAGIDTVEVGGLGSPSTTLAARELTLTAFDTGYWAIPPLRFQVGQQVVESEALLLRVEGMEVPKGARPADIKPIYQAPFDPVLWLSDHWMWVAGFALAGLVAFVVVLLIRRKRNAPKTPIVETPPLPLHVRVLAAFDALERERLWQLGEHKLYQSRLTDLVRSYLEERYKVPALERTTDELMHELRVSPLTTDQQSMLGNMLRFADMVKFAKALPAPQENEQMIASARRFVTETANSIPHEARA